MPNIFLKSRSGGIADHSELYELDYASSGHTGFASSDDLTTISGDLQIDIDAKDNYASWSFAVDGVTKDTITSGDVLDFVGGDNITITRSADDQVTISGAAGGEGVSNHSELDELDYASAGHTGFASETLLTTVSGNLQTNIDSKSDISHLHDDRYYTETEADALHTTLSGNLQTNIDGKADTVHAHGDLYYTETELNNGQLDTRYYTETEIDTELTTLSGNLQTNIDGKSDTGHAHTESDITDLGDYATSAELTTVSGALQTNIDGKDNYQSFSFAVDGDTKDAITSGDVLDFVGGDNITITRSADDQITISGSAGGGISNIIEDTIPQLGGDLDTNQKNIELQSVPTNSEEANGIIATMTVDANATGFGAALHMDIDEHWIEADADSTDTMPCQALALETGTGSKKVLLRGFIRDDSWDWDVGGSIYVSTVSGVLTQITASGTGDQVQAVGYATHADRMFFNPTLVMAEAGTLVLTESHITDLDKYTQAEVDTISDSLSDEIDSDITTLSGALQADIDGKSDIGHNHTSSDITDWQEAVDDSVNTLLVGGDNIALTYDDDVNTLTISGAVGAGISDIVEDTTPQLGGDLDLNGHNVDYGIVLTVSGTYEGIIMTVTVDDSSTAFGNALYCASDFHYERADADSISTMPCSVLALEVGSGSKRVLIEGQICNTDWDWFAGCVYVSDTTGGLRQTTVSGSDDQVQIAGWALSADTIFFRPNLGLAGVE